MIKYYTPTNNIYNQLEEMTQKEIIEAKTINTVNRMLNGGTMLTLLNNSRNKMIYPILQEVIKQKRKVKITYEIINGEVVQAIKVIKGVK